MEHLLALHLFAAVGYLVDLRFSFLAFVIGYLSRNVSWAALGGLAFAVVATFVLLRQYGELASVHPLLYVTTSIAGMIAAFGRVLRSAINWP
jgi:hypothetical protein